ncbi:MAG: cadherin domain-containing protein, partial [Chloroflexota bacterium]|nr:cadherin domain-containing protein [Chloroflexota bacterium]
MRGSQRGDQRVPTVRAPAIRRVTLGFALLVAAIGLSCGGPDRVAGGPPSMPESESMAASSPSESPAAQLEQTTGGRSMGDARPATGSRAQAGAADIAASRGDVSEGVASASGGEATASSPDAATVEELLKDGLHVIGASPAHLAIRGTPAATSVRCLWRGTARTTAQRNDAIRTWLQLSPTDAIPDVAYLEAFFTVVLDEFNPSYRETAKANFLAIARGGESREYLFLTCFADYAVTNFLLGTGTTPATVTVAYDRMGEAASYDLYVREHEAGTYGTDALQSRGAYEATLQAQVVAAERALSTEIGGREAVVFLAPMGAHNAIGFEAWQAVASWAVVTDDNNVVQAVRDDTPAGDPEHTQTLANLSSRITAGAAADGQATNRATRVDQLQQEYRDLGAYADITPGDGQTTTFTPAQPPAAPTCTNGTVIPTPAANRELVKDCETLLAARDTLRGTATLNWAPGTALTSWTGVTTSGTPTRVTGLNLASQSLGGNIPADIGNLFALTTLNLSTNSLTGDVPAELGWLDQLTELRLSGNSLTGCVPLNLRAVATNDLSSLNLPFCAPPPPANVRAGTPTASSVAVSWDAVANAAAYRVEVRQGSTGAWTTHRDTITGTSHTVDGLVCQTAYALRVRARGSGTTYGTAWSQPSGSVATTTATCPPPMFAETSYAFTVAEDTAVATQVGTIRATVAGGGPVTHTLTAGNTGNAWTLDATTGELKVAEPLDHETAPTYPLTVTAAVGADGSTTASVPVTITVTDVDEPPVFDAESYTFSIAEDAIVTTTPGTVTAVDPEGDTILYTITAGNTGGPWALDALAGRLVLNGRLDYETTPAYTLTVHADVLGSSRLTATTTVTVTVTDVADAPPAPTNLAATPAATSLALTWDAVPGATTYQVDYRVAETETWTTAANDLTTAAATLADLTCATAYEVRVRAYGSGAGYTDTWSAPSETLAAATATCPPPAFAAESYGFSVAENSAAATAVGTITATTTGSGAVTFAITAGNDAAAFAIDAATGALTVAGSLDHETTPRVSLTVEARAGGSQATTTVTITVTDVDEAPAFGTAEYEFSVAEDAATDAAVGSVSATDPEDGDLTYAITAGNEADAFALDSSSGALTVAGTLDYETTDEYNLTVTATDTAGHTATADVAITVTDVAFPPVFAETSYAWSVAEDAALGAALGTVGASDPEGGAVTFAITAGNDAGHVAIDSSTGALTVAGTLDHETTPSYNLTVEATSGGGAATATVPVTVTVTNVDEPPTFD